MLKRLFFVLVVLVISLATTVMISCSPGKTVRYTPRVICISRGNPSPYFSTNLNQNTQTVSIIYGEYDSSSLYEASFSKGVSVNHVFIDVIDKLPPVNPYFGVNASVITSNVSYILYMDQQTEDNTILKFLYSTKKDKNWFTNIIIPQGIPLLILNTEKTIIPVWQQKKRLYYIPIRKDKLLKPVPLKPAKLNEQFYLTKPIYPSQPENRTYFFAFDQLTKRVYLFSWTHNTLTHRIMRDIESSVYYIKKTIDTRYEILFYNKTKNEIGYINRYPDNKKIQRVTLSKETTSLFFTQYKGRTFFFFNELTATKEKKPIFAISVVFPRQSVNNFESEKMRYQKCILISNKKPIDKIKWISSGNRVFIIYRTPEGLYSAYINLHELIQNGK